MHKQEDVLKYVRKTKARITTVVENWGITTSPKKIMPKTSIQLDVPTLTVIEHVNNNFVSAVDYQYYRLMNILFPFDDEVAQEFDQMGKKIIVQIKNRAFSKINPRLVVAFLPVFESTTHTCGIYEGTEAWFLSSTLPVRPKQQ